MKSIQRILSLLLALVMLLSCAAFAAEDASVDASDEASSEASAEASAEENAEAPAEENDEASGEASDEGLMFFLMMSEEPFDDSAYTPIMLTSPDNDMRTDLQYSYVMDPDLENVYAYAHGVEALSLPRGVICDFSDDDIGEADSYVIQRSASEDFADAVTVEGLSEKSYAFQNLLLGEHFYWRAGTSLDTIEDSPVHEMTVTDIPPRVCYVDGGTNVRDIGGYDSYLVPGGKIRQGLYYRGANINAITEEGKRQFYDELGIRAQIDMRDEEFCLGPYVDGVEYYIATIPSTTEPIRFEEFTDVYKQVFEIIADADENPVFLHCGSGADRTGIVTFILLAVCGVSYEDMAHDYLFTNFASERIRYLSSEFNNWWAKLDFFAGETKADRAKNWLMFKGVSEEDVEHIREIFVEGYVSTYVPEDVQE